MHPAAPRPLASRRVRINPRLRRGSPWIDQLFRLRRDPASFAKLSLASLLCDTFEMRVIVERAGYDLVERLDIPRSQIDSVHRADHESGHNACVAGHEYAGRRRKQIHAQADGVANVRRTEEQQDEIGPMVHTPRIQGLTEIARLLR